MSLLINEFQNNNQRIGLELIGEIDIDTIDIFKKKAYEFLEISQSDIVFQCSQLEYIDSLGLGVLVSVLKKVKANNRAVKLMNLKSNLKKLFTITGLDKVFIIGE